MKKRIEQLLNGKFIYEQPGLLFSQDRIFATLKAGETTKDEIYFGTDDNHYRNILSSLGQHLL